MKRNSFLRMFWARMRPPSRAWTMWTRMTMTASATWVLDGPGKAGKAVGAGPAGHGVAPAGPRPVAGVGVGPASPEPAAVPAVFVPIGVVGTAGFAWRRLPPRGVGVVPIGVGSRRPRPSSR